MGVAGLSLLPDDPDNAVAVASSAATVAVAANSTTTDLIVETLTGPKVNGVKAVAARINGVCKDGTNRLLRFSNACWNTAGAAPANNTGGPGGRSGREGTQEGGVGGGVAGGRAGRGVAGGRSGRGGGQEGGVGRREGPGGRRGGGSQ